MVTILLFFHSGENDITAETRQSCSTTKFNQLLFCILDQHEKLTILVLLAQDFV